MKNLQFLLFLFILILTSCSESTEFWNIEHFNLDQTALKNEEKIKILYTSNGPMKENKKDFYYHYVVVSQETADTVNILSTLLNHVDENSVNKVFTFF